MSSYRIESILQIMGPMGDALLVEDSPRENHMRIRALDDDGSTVDSINVPNEALPLLIEALQKKVEKKPADEKVYMTVPDMPGLRAIDTQIFTKEGLRPIVHVLSTSSGWGRFRWDPCLSYEDDGRCLIAPYGAVRGRWVLMAGQARTG